MDSNLFLCRTVRVLNSNKDFWQLLGEICQPKKSNVITVKVALSIPPGTEKGQSQSVFCAHFWAFIFFGPCKYSKGVGSGLFGKAECRHRPRWKADARRLESTVSNELARFKDSTAGSSLG